MNDAMVLLLEFRSATKGASMAPTRAQSDCRPMLAPRMSVGKSSAAYM
eukprot:CAMPEP_0171077800 /NCGR_PEP_ID=MMETSP0766_2-20121228/14267_1 /TAXON_ID=439317 /ORGANISM="Gambierdiscus australes, Strain CAWD 149" /LENGTH=47 /DNA_ID= /DNA_START= /DNA_END= /DNA_ORIENTATION=